MLEQRMNSLIESEFPLQATPRLRYDLLRELTDSDSTYRLPGDNPTLGESCREIGEVQHSYIGSFRTLRHERSYGTAATGLATSVALRRVWYMALEQEFEAVPWART
jgi:hypothetical protein